MLASVNHPYISLLWVPRDALLLFQQLCGVVSLDEDRDSTALTFA